MILESRIVKAALKLAQDASWSNISLSEIAIEADISLAEIHKSFSSKKDILIKFSKAIDEEVLKRTVNETFEGNSPKDKIFDVVMTRFEVMQPYKKALKRILSDMSRGSGVSDMSLNQFWQTQKWMLEAADVPVSGQLGSIRVIGISSIYLQVLPIWLDDDDQGLAKTMASLDKKLQQGEDWLKRADLAINKGTIFLDKYIELFKKRKSTQPNKSKQDQQAEEDFSKQTAEKNEGNEKTLSP